MKLVLTAAEQAQAISGYIKSKYNLVLQVYPDEFDDKDMEVQPRKHRRFGVGDSVRLATWWLDRYDPHARFSGTFTVRASACPKGSTVLVRGEVFHRDGKYRSNDTLPALILVE